MTTPNAPTTPLTKPVLHAAGTKLPVGAVALGCSAAIHGALLATLAFVPASNDRTKPAMQLAHGDHAIKVRLVSPAPEIPDDQPALADLSETPEELEPVEESTDLAEPKHVHYPPVDAQPCAEDSPDVVNACDAPVGEQKVTKLLETPAPEPHADASAQTEPDAQPTAAPADQTAGADTEPEEDVRTTGNNTDLANETGRAEPATTTSQSNKPLPAIATPATNMPRLTAPRTGAAVIDLPRPDYPLVSRRRGEQGVVLLEIEVLPSGRAGQIKIVSGPDFPRLRRAATDAARRAEFKPATHNGRPVRDTVRIPFRFVLE